MLAEFKSGSHPLMLATDVAARGLGRVWALRFRMGGRAGGRAGARSSLPALLLARPCPFSTAACLHCEAWSQARACRLPLLPGAPRRAWDRAAPAPGAAAALQLRELAQLHRLRWCTPAPLPRTCPPGGLRRSCSAATRVPLRLALLVPAGAARCGAAWRGVAWRAGWWSGSVRACCPRRPLPTLLAAGWLGGVAWCCCCHCRRCCPPAGAAAACVAAAAARVAAAALLHGHLPSHPPPGRVLHTSRAVPC